MSNALFITAYDRPEYLRQALASWKNVRGLEDWHVVARIEPGRHTGEIYDLFWHFGEETGHPSLDIIVNPKRLGVLHHPWVGFEHLFETHDFVVRAEDDLRVSDDILEYFSWAQGVDNPEVVTIHGYTMTDGDPDEVQVRRDFNPLVWGTWRAFWQDLIGPTWDHDYSTNNGTPGVQAGWDWNLNTRILEEHQLMSIYPMASRVDNIGIHGTHSTPDNYFTSPSFQETFGRRVYREKADIR